METKEITCVVCPRGCTGSVTKDGEELTPRGYACPRGETYARQEFQVPLRTLTSTVKAQGYESPVIAVRSDGPMPKELLQPAVAELRHITVTGPFTIGRVVCEDILGTGVNIVLSASSQEE